MRKKTIVAVMVVVITGFVGFARAAKMPPSIALCASEPVKYVGDVFCDKYYYDGRLRYAVGVHNSQAFRDNRTKPAAGGLIGWPYTHQPYICSWKGRFWLQYLSNLKEEHVPPGRTLIMVSKDGLKWSNPKVAFPKYPLPRIHKKYDDVGMVDLAAGTFSVMHQRMGFYVAPNGRLLTLAFYSFCPHPRKGPNNGQGLGRVVREVYADGSFGPIYFIRYNRQSGWNESNTNYPFYTKSKDKGFLSACESLLADKLITLQWWEEDRGTDGFFAIKPGKKQPKALSYCHRPDGSVLAVWKQQLTALSADEGKSWTKFGRNKTLMTNGAKTWVQKTDDGRYALVYNHSATGDNRYPMSIMTSDDCYEFDNVLCVNGEVPPMRFQGIHKPFGPQYFRGIVEGNGNPPGDELWMTYSVNKEDIWVSRIPVPVRGTVDEGVSQDFEKIDDANELSLWNLYVPKWAPISIVDDPVRSGNKCMELRDEEPYDYAIAQRAFPESKKVTVKFRIYVGQVGCSVLDVEVQDKHGARPMKLRFDADWLAMDRMKTDPDMFAISTGRWMNVRMRLDCNRQRYALFVNGKEIDDGIKFGEKVESLERLVFRTGPWRGCVWPFIVDHQPGTKGLYVEDLHGTDDKSSMSVYLIDDVKTVSN